MEAQAHFFQNGHQSLSELDQYRQALSEEVRWRTGGSFCHLSWLWGGRGLKSHKMARRLGGDRKTKHQQEMFGVDTWPSACHFFHFPNRKTFPCRRPSTVLPPSVKLSTNAKQEMNLSALVSQSQKAKPQQSTSPRRGKFRQPRTRSCASQAQEARRASGFPRSRSKGDNEP